MFIIHTKTAKWTTRAFAKMYKSIVTLLVALLFLSLPVEPKFCVDSSECEQGKQCCDRVCLKRKSCDGLCMSDNDCDNIYGELCVDQSCTCASSPCLDELANTRIVCHYNSQCPKNETCKNGICQVEERTGTQPLNTSVLVVVATVGLIVFAGAFYLCLRQQKSSRPSLAAKEAHHQAMERAKTNTKGIQVGGSPSIKKNFSYEERGNGKNRLLAPKHTKPPLTSPCSVVELSAIIEEDEISEAIPK